MKFSPGIAVSQLSGSLGGTTASRNKGGQYFRNRAIPTLVTSPEAQNAKAILAAQSQGFADLTEAQRDSWIEWARQNQVTDTLGSQITLSGHQAYVALNSRLSHDSQTLLTAPPIINAPDALLTLTQTFDIGVGTFDTTFTVDPLAAGVKLWYRVAVTNSVAINYVTNILKFIGTSAAAQASPFDAQTLIEARWGALLVGQTVHFFISTFDTATGLLSVPRVAKGVVVET